MATPMGQGERKKKGSMSKMVVNHLNTHKYTMFLAKLLN